MPQATSFKVPNEHPLVNCPYFCIEFVSLRDIKETTSEIARANRKNTLLEVILLIDRMVINIFFSGIPYVWFYSGCYQYFDF